MSLLADLAGLKSVFVDTAPVIYLIEAHPEYGQIARNIFEPILRGALVGYSSVLILTEVLPKPLQKGDTVVVNEFMEFLLRSRCLNLIEITAPIAERAGRLRGRYAHLKALDALQISAALEIGADAFITNDKQLKQVSEIKILFLSDYL